jgi:hypothetical protein
MNGNDAGSNNSANDKNPPPPAPPKKLPPPPAEPLPRPGPGRRVDGGYRPPKTK